MQVKLYFIKASDFQPLLGQRVTFWTTYISEASAGDIGYIPFCSSATKLYPGRNGASFIILHTDSPGSDGDRIMRCPLECNLKENDYLPGLMILKAFLATGYDMGEGKVLVCVRSIGPRRTVQSKKDKRNLDMVEVGVFDDSETCLLKLWEDKVASAKHWHPNQTILLISKPTRKSWGTAPELGIGPNSMIDVDPQFPDADWLRNKAKTMMKRESVYIPFPPTTWDVDLAIHGPGRTLYTIADVEDQVRHSEPEVEVDFTGKLNVIIVEMKLMEHRRKSTTYCLEW